MRIKMLKGAGMGAKRKIEIRKVSCVGLWITLLLAPVCQAHDKKIYNFFEVFRAAS